MRLVHLKDSQGREHYVNPDHVVKVLASADRGISIRLSTGTDVVLNLDDYDTVLEVTDRLQGDEGEA